MTKLALCVLVASSIGCACFGGGGGGLHPGAFVVFAQDRLLVDQLESPTPVPVTVGSSSPAGLVTSDAPDLAEVSAAGLVVGHRPGRTVLRSSSSVSTLTVEVRPFRALSLQPAALSLRSGETAPLQVLADGQCCLQASDVTWQMSNPAVAFVVGSEVRAGTPGQATITALRGQLRVELAVSVVGR